MDLRLDVESGLSRSLFRRRVQLLTGDVESRTRDVAYERPNVDRYPVAPGIPCNVCEGARDYCYQPNQAPLLKTVLDLARRGGSRTTLSGPFWRHCDSVVWPTDHDKFLITDAVSGNSSK